LEISVLHLS